MSLNMCPPRLLNLAGFARHVCVIVFFPYSLFSDFIHSPWFEFTSLGSTLAQFSSTCLLPITCLGRVIF